MKTNFGNAYSASFRNEIDDHLNLVFNFKLNAKLVWLVIKLGKWLGHWIELLIDRTANLIRNSGFLFPYFRRLRFFCEGRMFFAYHFSDFYPISCNSSIFSQFFFIQMTADLKMKIKCPWEWSDSSNFSCYSSYRCLNSMWTISEKINRIREMKNNKTK